MITVGKVTMSKKYGIHTIELYAKNLKYTQVQKVIDRLEDCGKIYKVKSELYNINRHMKSTYLAEDGIRLRIYQSHNKSCGIGFIINPATFLSRKYKPIELWKPTEEAVNTLLEKLNEKLSSLGLDDVRAKDLSLSQMDLTRNFWYDKGFDVTPLIHICHKCFISRHFEAKDSKDKDEQKHLFEMTNKTVTVKVYDKIYELRKNDRCPKSLKDESVLRYEISLKREAFLKKLDLDRKDSIHEMLLAGYDRGEEILDDYYSKMLPFLGKILRYDGAKKQIESNIVDALMQEQMLYLLKKTSDSAGLSTAVRKLKEHYKIVDDRRVKKILSAFDKLGIAPITIPKK